MRPPPRQLDAPQPGYWLIRLCKNGPWCPASIQYEQPAPAPGEPDNLMERSPILTARVNGEIVALDHVWLRQGRPLTKGEYEFHVAERAWLRDHTPSDPKVNPTEAVNLRAVPTF